MISIEQLNNEKNPELRWFLLIRYLKKYKKLYLYNNDAYFYFFYKNNYKVIYNNEESTFYHYIDYNYCKNTICEYTFL